MSLIPYGRSGHIVNKRLRSGRSYGQFISNPYVQQAARMSANYAASKIQNWWRARRSAPSTPAVGRRLFGAGSGRPSGGGLTPGTVPSSSSTRRVSFPKGRGFKGGRGSYRGRVKGKRVKRVMKRRRKGKMMKSLWRMMHCPQELKWTNANYQVGAYGIRSYLSMTCGSAYDLKNCSKRRPNSLFYSNTTQGSGVTQTTYGVPKALHISSFVRKITLQNRSNWIMHLKVYECLLRRDHDYSKTVGTTAFNNFINGLLTAGEDNKYNQGPFQETMGLPNDNLNHVAQNPTFTPYNSSPFCAMFKIIKTTSMTLSPNDYQVYIVRCRRKAFDQVRLDGYINSDINTNVIVDDRYMEGIGGWSKVVLCTWVGGPVDTGNLTENKQSKSACTLAVQVDSYIKFYYELDFTPLLNVASSNATSNEFSFSDATGGNYKTLNNVTYGIPYTEVVETIAAPSVVNVDDVPALQS